MNEDLVWDLETDGLLPDVTKIHMVVVTDVATGKTEGYTDEPLAAGPDAEIAGTVREGLARVKEARVNVGFNSYNYDLLVVEKLYPELLPFDGIHVDLRVLGNAILQKDRLYAMDAMLVKRGRLPAHLKGRESLEAWSIRAGGAQKSKYSDGWENLNPSMWEYGLQDGNATLAVYQMMMKSKWRLPWAVFWLEMEFARLMGRQQKNGWQFDESAAVDLSATVGKTMGDAEMTMVDSFGSWYRLNKAAALHALVYSKKRGRYFVFPKTKVPAAAANAAQWRIQVPKKTMRRSEDIGNRPTYYTEGAPFTPVEYHVFNPGSRQDIASRLIQKYNWTPLERTPTGQPKVTYEAMDLLDWDEAKAAGRYLRVQKIAGYVQGWLKASKGGRIYGSINTNRATTRRCTHDNPNVAQVPSSSAELGRECRECFTADSDWKLVGADAAGLELRTLANALYPYDGGAYADVLLNGDIHNLHAGTVLEIDPEVVTKEQRTEGKTLTYSFLYGAGNKLLKANFNRIPEATKVRSGGVIRSRYETGIVGLGELIEDLKEELTEKGHIKSLDGGKLESRSEHSLLNLRLQSDGAILMKAAAVFAEEIAEEHGWIEGRDWKLVGNIHDEIQATTPAELADNIGACLVAGMLKAGEFFDMKLPIDGQWMVGDTWAETH